MFMPEELPTDFPQNGMSDIVLGRTQHNFPRSNFDELPPLLFTPPSPLTERGREVTHMAISRGHTHPRAFSHSPEPTYARRPDARHRNSDLILLKAAAMTRARGFYSMEDYTQPSSSNSLDAFMVPPSLGSHLQEATFAQAYSVSEISTPEFAFSSSPPAAPFSTHSSPGYFSYDLPSLMDPTRPRSDCGRLPSSQYLGAHHHHTYSDGAHPLSHETPARYRSNTWNTHPGPAFPQLPHAQRPGFVPGTCFQQLRTHPLRGHAAPRARHVQAPGTGEERREAEAADGVPLLPRAQDRVRAPAPGGARPDVQVSAALIKLRVSGMGYSSFCYSQCARRERECEYPTESRRGQHNRNRSRFNSQKGSPPTEAPSPASSTADGNELRL
ncbi:hypothetical protein DFH09DRAFT_1109538 [Mycena vulgaris]|nr:hypothetical protein DFH09DRAFT_1109538 [Mycena vulgaris]